MASVMAGSWNTLPHSPKEWFAVMINEPLITCADQFGECRRFGLVLGDGGQVASPQHVEVVEPVRRSLKREFAARHLQLLDEIRCAREQTPRVHAFWGRVMFGARHRLVCSSPHGRAS